MTNKIPSTLGEIISPLTQEEFLRRYWGRSFLHLSGGRGKFEGLFPWMLLNHVLEYHRISPIRLRLFKDGESVKPRMYAQIHENREPEIRVSDFIKYLREGATLILDGAEELSPPLRRLAISLERLFRVRVQVNLYAGWGKNRGFDLHWDDHDILVLQVAGSKRWEVYSPTRFYPLRPDIEETPLPTTKPAWESLLQEGDMLYLPRGWWHVAYPIGEPCLHLTVGFNNPTGLDLLQWFAKSLRAVPEIRQDLPHLCVQSEKADYLERLKKALSEAWKTDLMDRFMREGDEQAVPRPIAHLPLAATSEGLPLGMSTRIRIAAPRKICLAGSRTDGLISFRCCGREWTYPRQILPTLEKLNEDGEFHLLEELMTAVQEQVDRTAVENIIREMIRDGLLVTED